MFTVRTISKPLSIKTFELDIRTDIAISDLAIEVYTVMNGYTDVFNVESAWTLVANTEAIPVPGSTSNSVLIPVQDFETIYMAANELRSFYITMKNRYIESTVNALVGSGETASENDELRIDVGSGMATYKFSSAFDTTIAPQFAGIIHYEVDTAEACETPAADTKLSIEYKFLVNASGLDPSVISIFNTETKSFFDEQLEDEEGYLRDYKLKYQLTQLADPTSTSSERPLGAYDRYREKVSVSIPVQFFLLLTFHFTAHKYILHGFQTNARATLYRARKSQCRLVSNILMAC